jgi:ATP-dependent DNA helicase RecG
VSLNLTTLERLMTEPEGERLEFKEAKTNYHFDKLVEYCAALSNEGGGKMILGVSDRRPRTVVGSAAFSEPGRTLSGLMDRLRLRIGWTELQHPRGRVLIFDVPAHPIGMPIEVNGAYLTRQGDSIRSMRPDELRRILEKAEPDFSAQPHPKATLAELDPHAVELFRKSWSRKAKNTRLTKISVKQLLTDAELLIDGKLTHAALIFLGSREALTRYLPQAEVVFEYRSSDASISHQQRIEFRQGFLPILDKLWKTIDLRNELIHYQDGLFMRDIPVFSKTVVREALLNAVTHRDYRLPGSVFIKQFPRKLEITSPGGLPAGITLDNILRKQAPRNRRIAETCAKSGLVERSGQGIDRMFEQSIKEGKPRPDFTGTDDYEVRVTLLGHVQNPQFLRFLEKVGAEREVSFSVEDLLVLDALQREELVPPEYRNSLAQLLETGIVERVGKGRGVRFVLSRRFYSFLGRRGAYTRKRGLDRETHKALLVKHVLESSADGAKFKDLQEVLNFLSRNQVQTLLRELRDEGKVRVSGLTNAGRWFLAD